MRSLWSRRRFLAVAAAAAASAAVSAACSSAGGDPSSTTRRSRPRVIRYGPDASREADLWLPSGDDAHPVVVLVHGGFWRAGYDRTLMTPLARTLPDRGWAAWNIEYRRVGEPGGGWPGTLEDVAQAVDHLHRLAGTVDPRRVVVIGHSAGGQLAPWTALRGGLPERAPGADPMVRPVAAVALAGLLDLVRAADDGLGGGAVDDLLGGAPHDRPERYEIASPAQRLPVPVPVRCVHGRQDDIVPLAQSTTFVAADRRRGGSAQLDEVDGDHFTVIDPDHAGWTRTLDWIDRFR